MARQGQEMDGFSATISSHSQAALISGMFASSNVSGGSTTQSEELDLIAKVYHGETDEVTRHGKIDCARKGGLITELSGVTLPNGTFTSAVERGLPEADDWRVEGEDGRWIYGTLDITKRNINFLPHKEQPVPQAFAATSLPSHLIKSAHACNLVQDEHVAVYLYGALASGSWKMAGSGRPWQCNWIQAAEAVTQMRGLNEPYSHAILTYESERQGCEDDELVNEIMNSLGWEFDDYPDMTASHKRARKLVEEHEQKPVGRTPGWYAPFITALRPYDTDLVSRLNRAAFTGRIPFSQWCKFWQFYDLDAPRD